MTRRNTVLIVDDARHNRCALREILNDTYIVLEAANGDEALNLLQEKYQVISGIVLDLIMPGMSGMELLQIMHADERYRNIPVIVMVREIDDEVECKCVEYGACDFLRKPYDPTIVRLRVKNVIEKNIRNIDRELKNHADYDILTGIYNKTRFFYDTKSMLNTHPDRKFAFIRIDIEKFQ